MEPKALPEIAMPLANPRYFWKYEVTMKIPGGKDKPAPVPNRKPYLKKKIDFITFHWNCNPI